MCLDAAGPSSRDADADLPGKQLMVRQSHEASWYLQYRTET
jgi:hypothetical protein